jgi:phosphoglucosamine mutase
MVRKYFGTDGIRGKANEGAMTAETALRVGMAAVSFVAVTTAIVS